MARVVSVGAQDFDQLISNDYFYVDKTLFIKEWWENGDSVTLITRPRRFGKTLNMSMMERFWSNQYAGQDRIFQNLDIWKEEKYRMLQGTYPVISLSFADVKEDTYEEVRNQIFQIITDLYSKYYFLRDCGKLNEKDKAYFDRIGKDMSDSDASKALHRLSDYLHRYYGKKVIILLDEYDTPMQEAFVQGFWDKLVSFTRSLFNSTFKTNPYMERAIMTGITRVSKESIFSDLNNLKVITTTSKTYSEYFGFTEREVFAAMDEYGMGNKEEVKKWYDVMLEPLNKEDDGIILEFKIHDCEDEADLKATVQAALKQIEEKRYEQTLLDHGLKRERIRKYGFAFEGKTVLIG